MATDQSEKFLIEEIKIVQDIIKRMSGHSFLIKGWTITLVVAALLFKVEQKLINQIPLAYIPLIMFWFLDSYYLRQEKLYRELHKWLANNRLKTDVHLFDLSTTRFESAELALCKVAACGINLVFYMPIAVLILIYWRVQL